jgi:hypothetical protein
VITLFIKPEGEKDSTFRLNEYNLFEFKGAAGHFPLKKPPDFVST